MERVFRTDSGGYISREFRTDNEPAENEAERARKAMREPEPDTRKDDGGDSDYARELRVLVAKYRQDHGEAPNVAELARLEMRAELRFPKPDPGALRVESKRR